MKAFAIGIGGFVLAALVFYGGLVAYGTYKKERIKEQILGDLACQSPTTVQKFGLGCIPANASPSAPTQ